MSCGVHVAALHFEALVTAIAPVHTFCGPEMQNGFKLTAACVCLRRDAASPGWLLKT